MLNEFCRKFKKEREELKPKLFLFHFAGGSSYSFQFMIPYLYKYEIIPLELPGRGRRFKQNLITDFEVAANDLLDQVLINTSNSNFVFYGHSLGAQLAFRVCQLLIKKNKKPSHLVVSGNPGPGIRQDKNLDCLNRQEFIDELKSLGGLPDEVINNIDLMDFFIPILKADFKLVNNENFWINEPIDIPLYALMGDKEESVNEIQNWEKFTTGIFKYQVLTGNHFFIYEHVEAIVEAISTFNGSAQEI